MTIIDFSSIDLKYNLSRFSGERGQVVSTFVQISASFQLSKKADHSYWKPQIIAVTEHLMNNINNNLPVKCRNQTRV